MELTQPIRFEWAQVPDDVWNCSPFHVDGLHTDVAQRVLSGVAAARASSGPSPLGIAIQGARGAGKTHMLGWIREQVQSNDGFFFLISLLDGAKFWESTMLSVLDGLLRESDGRECQLKTLLRRLCSVVGLSGAVQGAIAGDLKLSPGDLSLFVASLRRYNRAVGVACQDTARALVLFASPDQALQDMGYNYLQSMEESEAGDRAAWGMQRGAKPAQLLVKEVSDLLALVGPSLIAVDQIDTLIAQSLNMADGDAVHGDGRRYLLIDQIADGLMGLRQVTRRTITVVACLAESWTLIRRHAVDTVPDRFVEALQLENIPTAEIGRALIAKRLTAQYREIGFNPPYSTWPILPSAFEEAMDFTPRGLMKRVASHIDGCLRQGRMEELAHLTDYADPLSQEELEGVSDPGAAVSSEADLSALDQRFASLKKIVDVDPAFDDKTEDAIVPGLLYAGLAALIEETKDSGRVLFQDSPAGGKIVLHARLREDLDETTEDETHWAFRAVASEHPVSALNRLRGACTAAGLHHGMAKRKLHLLRNLPWSGGKKTQEALAAFEAAGGVHLRLEADDLKVFAALKDMLAEQDVNLTAWLRVRRPASSTKLFREVFGDEFSQGRTPAPPPPISQDPAVSRPAAPDAIRSTVGESQAVAPLILGDLTIALESLRKHTAIFAGSGSGKTVLIRRLVEECALRGVSAIVLDPNNDLARLGDPWPAAPANWSEADKAKASAYIEETDVVIWTPRREAGRPLSFKPLPDFRSVLADPDEFNLAIDAAVATLAPRGKVDGEISKAVQGRAVLREALHRFARAGGSDLRKFIGMLAELPTGISTLSKAEKLAAEMADNLTAAMVNDPLFGGEGRPVDPGDLLTPAGGKRARISVISFIGLPSDDQRQSFVNQLQMALFAWIKEHPAGERPLGGLFVMDEAQTLAPSGAMTPCTHSTLALASQARKYGLGLVFATQAPKGLHNRIPGNAATQFFGFLNSPIQIAAAREMAQAKGSDVLDISRLTSGQFYASGEGTAFCKVQAPMCLSHHPTSPLTTEEVLARAKGHR
ncbi:ATP-binding protein [Allorhizocola rhizosphaerae]|uniref:ATP-binding protein n=1 Tax=Allorhizocola rhizosphaerae TaxID=1872709 RepID=UPI000E3B8A89|nr:ATP-binding protein [Allorhizocola rhizosphaerae]